jgi:hypothetical protein
VTRAIRLIAVILMSLWMSGCLLLPKGTPVFVDARHGKLWSGHGVLLEVSEDRAYCRVAVRNRALVVEKRWVDCKAVHRRAPKRL